MDNVTINITEAPITVTVTVEEAGISNAILHSLATAISDFLVASGSGVFVKKTLAEVKTILGLGTAAYTASTDYAAASHNQSQTTVIAAAFQTPVFANPLDLDATTYKDFKCGIITGNTTINMTGEVDGDAGMIELIIDGTGGYVVAMGAMFTKKLGATSIVTTLNADNFISWRKIDADIVYTIIQKV